jgi:hypothetical protein
MNTALRRYENNMATICRLPPELLAQIFWLLQADPSQPSEHHVDGTWTRVMLVCGLFRDLAIRTPMLWTVFDRTRGAPKWHALCITRAAGAPLCVQTHDAEDANLLARAWKAHVQCQAVTTGALDTTLPILRDLLISRCTDASFTITSSFLGGTDVPLRRLELHSNGIILDAAPRMPRLQWLKLRNIHMRPDCSAVIGLLDGTPMLEELHIIGLYLLDTDDLLDIAFVVPIARRVSLPRLKMLLIQDTPAEASAFARMVPTPSTSLTLEVLDPSEGFSGLGLELTDNHSHVHDAYLAFVRPRPDAEGLSQGRLTWDFRVNHATIEFGRSRQFIRGVRMQLEKSQCSFELTCVLDRPHPILEHVGILHVLGFDPALSDDVDPLRHSHLMPSLHTLVLELSPDGERPPELLHIKIKEWIQQQHGRIKLVEFISCPSPTEQPPV